MTRKQNVLVGAGLTIVGIFLALVLESGFGTVMIAIGLLFLLNSLSKPRDEVSVEK